MPWGNLYNWLLGSARDREFAAMREQWAETENLWQRSPFQDTRLVQPVVDIVFGAMAATKRNLCSSVTQATCHMVDRLLWEEYLLPIEPDWYVIERHPDIAIEFRQALARRARWSSHFEFMFGLFKERMHDGLIDLFRRLPPSCDGSWREDEFFGVPLLDLVSQPAEFVEALWQLTRTRALFDNNICFEATEQAARNMFRASGRSLYEDLSKYDEPLILPTRQKVKSPHELAKLYLDQTPLLAFTQVMVPFHIPHEARFEHCHIVGGTGHGKTQLMQRMIHHDLVAAQTESRSVVVIDSQGDLINKLMRLKLFDPDEPQSLAERVIIIDPADVGFPCSLNLFDSHLDRLTSYSLADRERVLNGVVELYELFFSSMLGSELTQKQGVIFRYLARLMLVIPNANIHTLMRIMEDGKAFKPYMAKLEGSARFFFEKEFFQPSFSATKQQILKRLWGVLSTPAFERMFAQPDNKLDLFEALNEGKIILISTAKDLLKNEGSALLGRFFIAMLAQAALERSTIPASDRVPTYVYVDEAQEYFDDSIETILNQARKYKVGLTLAHQTLSQLSPKLRSAMLANTSLKCAGGVSSRDAHELSGEMRTSSDFIEDMHRFPDRTEFAVWLKHETPRAVRLSIPLGFLERQPIASEEAFADIMNGNRERYACSLADLPNHTFGGDGFDDDADIQTPRAREAKRGLSALKPEQVERTPTPVDDDDAEPTYVPPPVPPLQPRTPVAERELGKGGSQHRYVQHLIKGLAEERGFRAVIEAPAGNGQVDIALFRDTLSIACEISVTSTTAYEAQNLVKCVAAGFTYVFAIGANAKRLKAIESAAKKVISEGDLPKIVYLTADAVPAALDALMVPEVEEHTVKGYKVKVQMTAVDPADAQDRRSTIARVIAQSLRNIPGT